MQRFRILLWPFGLIYGLVMALRNLLFDIGILKQSQFDLPVIGIGNLSVGGSGKTPMTLFLSKLLADKYPTGILSRGYGRQSKGYLLADENSNAEILGDEPYMMSRQLDDVQVVVCEDRVMGVLNLLNDKPEIEVVVLDDALQHRHIKPGLQILLTTYYKPYFDDSVLPVGYLREFKSGSRRADIVIVTKCPNFPNTAEVKHWKKRLNLKSQQHLFFAQYINGTPVQVFGNNTPSEDSVVLVTGIADSKQLLGFIETKHLIKKHFKYADHHRFSQGDLAEIIAYCQIQKCKTLFTTEKDWVRLEVLKDKLKDISVFTLSVEVRINEESKLLSIVESYIAANKL